MFIQTSGFMLTLLGLGSPHTYLYHAALPLVLLPLVRRQRGAAGARGSPCCRRAAPRRRRSRRRRRRAPTAPPPPAAQMPRFRPFCERLVQTPGTTDLLWRLREGLSSVQ